MESSTPELLALGLSGDRRAMGRVVAEILCPVVERRLARHLALLGVNRQEHRDLVQGALLHLLERDAEVLRRWDARRGGLEGYVAVVAENFVLSRLRKKSPPRPVDDLDVRPGSEESPEAGASFAGLVRRLVAEMSDDEAALFHAVFMEELSPEEAAGQLGVGLEAVYKRIQRLRARLRELVSNPGEPGRKQGKRR
jgi:RNA polymerase sigma factor (sigma-70 family)